MMAPTNITASRDGDDRERDDIARPIGFGVVKAEDSSGDVVFVADNCLVITAYFLGLAWCVTCAKMHNQHVCRRTEQSMRLPRRKFLRLAAGSAAVAAMPRIARAETYPARPVHIIVGFAPGAASDIIARLIGDWLSERLGQQFVIDNRPGAGSNIGTEAVGARAGRRLHAAAGLAAERDQRVALRQSQFQFPPRYRPGREHHALPHGHGGESIASGQDGPDSSPMPRPIRASSTWLGRQRHSVPWRASCSNP